MPNSSEDISQTYSWQKKQLLAKLFNISVILPSKKYFTFFWELLFFRIFYSQFKTSSLVLDINIFFTVIVKR